MKILGLENLLAPNGRAPSVLNGGLNNELVLGGLGVFLFIGGWLEVDYQRRKADVPGDELEPTLPPTTTHYYFLMQ